MIQGCRHEESELERLAYWTLHLIALLQITTFARRVLIKHIGKENPKAADKLRGKAFANKWVMHLPSALLCTVTSVISTRRHVR